MNSFWGCETEAVTELSGVFDTRAARLRALIQAAAGTVRATEWIGPDADGYRRRIEEMVEVVIEVVETIRELGELLGDEAEEQEICSRPEAAPALGSDPLGIRATPPWVPEENERVPPPSGPGRGGWGPLIGGPFAAKDPFALADRLPQLPDLGDLGPLIGGPLAAKNPFALADRLPQLPDLGDLGPWIGGPLIAEDPLRAIPAPRPVPEGEEFALDPEILAEAQRDRRLALGAVPVAGQVQTLMGIHAGTEGFLDRAEQNLEESGLGMLTPAVSAARVPQILAGGILGEQSVLGQTVSAIDDGIANVMQTSEEVSTAIGDGDVAGAIRAGERGIYRHTGAVADIVTATPVPAIAETASELIGLGAEGAEIVNPQVADGLREAEQIVRDAGLSWEQGADRLTDGEGYYDLRRKYLPTPWDPTE